jgi:D-cysteine desulfhydrase
MVGVLRGPRIDLGTYPTPVARLDALSSPASTLWVKRDDLTSPVYGGNKVRKLELVLAAARAAGKTRILTIGAIGSHQVVAAAIYGQRFGFAVEAVLVSQPATPHAERNLRVALAHGLHAIACPAWSLAPAYVASRWGRDVYFVPLGGSSPLGSLGYVDGALELAAQISAGLLAEPDVAIVALGSGGTAAGLAVGFEQAGLKTRVLGVAVAPPTPVVRHLARRLAQKTAKLAGLPTAVGVRAAKRIDVEGQWMGRGYGHPTDEGRAATEIAAGVGLALDATYTAKAFACALAQVKRGELRELLYWHTLSSAPLPAPADAEAPLPPALARLFH